VQLLTVADTRFANGGARSSSAGARIEVLKAPRGVGWGVGLPPSPGPSRRFPKKFFD